MSTAELAAWLHRQATWVRFRDSSSQPLADHPPVPPVLQRKGGEEGPLRPSRPLEPKQRPCRALARHHCPRCEDRRLAAPATV